MKKFEITSGSLVCSDPCYSTDVWCMGIVDNVKKGTWVANSTIETIGGWGERNCDLVIHHEDTVINERMWEEIPGSFGVDSGQFGFFDTEHYRKADSVQGLKRYDFGGHFPSDDDDIWYECCCNITLTNENKWGVLPNGVVSSSGLGDGSYGVYGIKNAEGEYVAFKVIFIDLNEIEVDEDWNDNEN